MVGNKTSRIARVLNVMQTLYTLILDAKILKIYDCVIKFLEHRGTRTEVEVDIQKTEEYKKERT